MALGYVKGNGADGLETEDSFFERTSGVLALYAAITQTDPLPGKKLLILFALALPDLLLLLFQQRQTASPGHRQRLGLDGQDIKHETLADHCDPAYHLPDCTAFPYSRFY